MMKWIKFLLVAYSGLVLSSCSEFQEPQIDQEYIEVFVPRDSLRTDIATQLFYWYEISGAAKYELQIVTPSFAQINRLVLDTNISANKFEFTLTPGEYEWSVRGYNNSSATDYTVHKLFIDSTIDLSNQVLKLQTPVNRDTSNLLTKSFSWQGIYNADNYHFEIWEPDANGTMVYAEDASASSINYTLPDEGSYYWRVRGENSFGSTTIYSSREFYLDTARPQILNLNEPTDNDIVTDPSFDFIWTRDNSDGSSRVDTLYISKNANMSNAQRIAVRSNSYSMDTLSPGYYYWQLRSSDKAGNAGDFSYIEEFSRQ